VNTHTNIHTNMPSCPHFHALSALGSVTAKMDHHTWAEVTASNSPELYDIFRDINVS